PGRAWRIRPRSNRSSTDTACVSLLIVRLDRRHIQSNGARPERHVQDKLFLGRKADIVRLDGGSSSPHGYGVSRPDGRSRISRKAAGEESPGSIDMRCRITSGGGDPRESATENEPLPHPKGRAARVKRCGKSAPRI